MRRRHPRSGRLRGLLPVLCAAIACGAVQAAELQVAVASNFRAAMGPLAAAFEAQTGHRLRAAYGSTGKHYAQIVNGAPFDAFLAADRERPERLESEGLAVPGSRFTYAIGRLVLWSPQPGLVDAEGSVLNGGDFRRLAIANPDLAPYGAAARSVLEALGLWEGLNARVVRGENIAQAFHFVASGNAELGFIALAQLRGRGPTAGGSRWLVPQRLYAPVVQQAVLLSERPAAAGFLRWMQGEGASEIIRDHGYDLP